MPKSTGGRSLNQLGGNSLKGKAGIAAARPGKGGMGRRSK